MNGRQWRGTVWGGRVLLFAALLLGIVTMHTLGHPASDESPSAPPAHSMTADGTTAAPHTMAAGGQENHGGSHGTHGTHGTHDGDGMDPMSVCLAVLGVWSAAALLGAYVFLVVRHRRAVDHFAAVRARILLALRPIPPPPTADRLAALSVLRI